MDTKILIGDAYFKHVAEREKEKEAQAAVVVAANAAKSNTVKGVFDLLNPANLFKRKD